MNDLTSQGFTYAQSQAYGYPLVEPFAFPMSHCLDPYSGSYIYQYYMACAATRYGKVIIPNLTPTPIGFSQVHSPNAHHPGNLEGYRSIDECFYDYLKTFLTDPNISYPDPNVRYMNGACYRANYTNYICGAFKVNKSGRGGGNPVCDLVETKNGRVGTLSECGSYFDNGPNAEDDLPTQAFATFYQKGGVWYERVSYEVENCPYQLMQKGYTRWPCWIPYSTNGRAGGGCFDPETMITLSNGEEKKAEDIATGDLLWNPIKKKALKVKKVVAGPERIALIEIGVSGKLLKVSSEHPFMTKDGLKQVKTLALTDQILDQSGKYISIESIKALPIIIGQKVINFELETESSSPEDRMLLANGIVTGDFALQLSLAKSIKEREGK